ncbi:MAG: penicillin-binding protein 2, partial [Gammaproteobacteria bacterium]|nr:penicillin-binding protein 2 [Gammaproteobacteria bacterium]
MLRQLTLKDHFFETRLFMSRVIALIIFGGILLLVLLGRLWYLQVIEHEHFTTLSEDNRVKLQPIPPNRG